MEYLTSTKYCFSVHYVPQFYTVLLPGIANKTYPELGGEYKLAFGHTFRNGTMLAYRKPYFSYRTDLRDDSDYILHKYTNGTWYVTQSEAPYSEMIHETQLLRNENEENSDIAPEYGWSFSVQAAHYARHWINDSTIRVLPEPGMHFAP